MSSISYGSLDCLKSSRLQQLWQFKLPVEQQSTAVMAVWTACRAVMAVWIACRAAECSSYHRLEPVLRRKAEPFYCRYTGRRISRRNSCSGASAGPRKMISRRSYIGSPRSPSPRSQLQSTFRSLNQPSSS